jgi:integrase
VQLGRVAAGDDPVEDRQLDHRAITVKELCTRDLADLQAGLILGKGGRPKKASTIITDTGRIERHTIPLIGTRRVKDITKTDIKKVLKDIIAGKTRVSVKTKKLRGKAIVRGDAGTATRTVGFLGGILTYAVEAGIIESNPARGIRKLKDNVRKRRLSEAEYRILGQMLRDGAEQEKYTRAVDIIRQPALIGCRRSEMIGLKWTEADTESSCLRLEDSKEGESIRPIGLPVVAYLERRRADDVSTYVFPGQSEDNAFGGFPNHWKHLFEGSPAIRCDSPRPASELREHRQRSRFHRGDHRGARGPCQGFGDEQIHPYTRHRAHDGCGHHLRLHSRAPRRHRV